MHLAGGVLKRVLKLVGVCVLKRAVRGLHFEARVLGLSFWALRLEACETHIRKCEYACLETWKVVLKQDGKQQDWKAGWWSGQRNLLQDGFSHSVGSVELCSHTRI